jgi:hypothetical protein
MFSRPLVSAPARRLAACLILCACACLPGRAADSFAKWEPEIRAFEASDRTNPPPRHAVEFVGSSSIRFWTSLANDFPELQTIRRGFGGCEMKDVTHFADRIIFPYHPSRIVVYAGDNDIAAGVKPEKIAADFKELVRMAATKDPEAEFYYIAVKPCPSRWKWREEGRKCNQLVAEFAGENPKVHFVNIWDAMLGPNGEPDKSLFRPDYLHMNPKGYAIWTRILKQDFAAAQTKGK